MKTSVGSEEDEVQSESKSLLFFFARSVKMFYHLLNITSIGFTKNNVKN